MLRRRKNRKSILSYYNSDYFLNFPNSIFNIGLYPSEGLSPQQNFVDFLGRSINLKAEDKLLDAGCGSGKAAEFLSNKYGCDVIGITISEKQVEDSALVMSSDNVDVKLGDCHEMPFSDEEFTKAVCLEAAFHFYDKAQFSRELFRVLKQGGEVAIADITLEKPNPLLHKDLMKCIPVKMWKEYLESAGFKEVNIISLGANTFSPALRYFSSRDDLLTRFPTRHRSMLVALKHLKSAYRENSGDYVLITAKKK